MQSIVATLLIAGCAYSISASAGNVQIQVLDRDGKPVPEAVVVLYPSAATAATAPSLLQASPTIEQERMRFVPALTVVAPGTTLRFTNQDRWATTMCAARRWALQPRAGQGAMKALRCGWRASKNGQAAQAAETTVRQPGVLLLGCHLHGSMRGHVFVTDSAWTLKTDADGIARFTAVPDGAAQLRVWHAEQLVDLPRKNLQVQPTPVLDTMQLSVVPRPRRPLPASAPAPARAASAPHIHY